MGKNTKINHSKPQHLGVKKSHVNLLGVSKEVSKKICICVTTGGAIASGQT